MLRKLLWFGAGAAAGGYLLHRRQHNLAVCPQPLTDASGSELSAIEVELAGGERVDVVEAGVGPPILLVPGLSGDKEVFRHQIGPFSQKYRVIAPDLRLRFDGVRPRFDQFAHDVATILEKFEEPSASVLGLSFGGPIAMRFAALYPEKLRALILTNTLARLDLSHVGFNRTLLIPLAYFTSRFSPEPLMRRFADLWGRLGVWVYDASPGNERVVDYQLDSAVRVSVTDGNGRMETFRGLDLRGDLSAIQTPALVIGGVADLYTLPEWQREIAALLPNSAYVEIPGGGHLSLISNAEIFNRAVLDWLAELPEARPAAFPPGPAQSQ